MKFKIFSTILALSLITLVGCAEMQPTEEQTPAGAEETSTEPSEFTDWLTYESPKGFSFKYPQGYQVFQMTQDPSDPQSANTTTLHIVSTEMEGMTPSLEINVSPYGISFSLWEGMEWEAFPKIIETFKSN